MDKQAQRRLIDEIADLISQGSTYLADDVKIQDAATYVGPERQQAERDVLFRSYPLVVGASGSVPNPGDFVSHDIGGTPVITVRGQDGVVRNLVNICRHRGNRVCFEESGNRKYFVCQYHAWTYDQEGRCRTFVDREGFSSLQREDFGLVALPTAERHGLIWVHPDPVAHLDVESYLGEEYDQQIGALGIRDFHLYRRALLPHRFNWKLGADTFQEVFHIAYLHKDTVAPLFLGNTGTYEDFGLHYRYTAVRKTFPQMLQQPREDHDLLPQSAIVHLLFPNTLLIWQLDHIEMWQFYPDAEHDGRCIAEISMLVPEEPTTDKAMRHWENNWEILEASVMTEDFGTMEQIQRNLASGSLPAVVFGRNEVGLQHFHGALESELSGGKTVRPADAVAAK